MKYKVTIQSKSKEDTIKLGKFVSNFLKRGFIILLTGDLGAGKTTFTKGIAQGLEIKENVISPTFNILKCYFNKKINLYHIDAYRLNDNKSDIGLDEFIEGDGVCVIEWPNYIDYLLKNCQCLVVKISNILDNTREIEISSDFDKYKTIFEELEKNYV